jgi:hypothetical protein
MFQLLGDARWHTNDYTAGMEVNWKGWNFGAETFYREFRNDPTITSKPGLDTGFGQPAPRPGAITSLDRDVPLRSRAIVTRANVRGSISDRLHVVLRGFIDDERMKAPFEGVAAATSTKNADRIFCDCASFRASLRSIPPPVGEFHRHEFLQ